MSKNGWLYDCLFGVTVVLLVVALGLLALGPGAFFIGRWMCYWHPSFNCI